MIEFLRVEFDSGLDCEEVDNGSHKLNSIFLLIDIIGKIGLRVVFLGQPVENIGNEFEIWFVEVLKRHYAVIVEGPQHLAEGTTFSIAHLI